MESATERGRITSEQAVQERRFERMVVTFLKTWQPQDPEQAACFGAQLHMIVRQIYADASEPYVKALTNAAFLASSPPTYKGDVAIQTCTTIDKT